MAYKNQEMFSRYLSWISGEPKCACGCGEALSISYKQFCDRMRLYKSPPMYKAGHNNKNTLYAKYEEWLSSKPVCECGCGEVLNSKYESYRDAMYRTGAPPRYKSHHYHSGKKCAVDKDVSGSSVKVGHCNIVMYSKPHRCKVGNSCDMYLKCLEFVVVENRRDGWRSIERG